MKYDALYGFQEYLKQRYCANTAKKYYQEVKNLFEDLQFDSLNEIDHKIVEHKIRLIRQQSRFSAAKQGLMALHDYDHSFALPDNEVWKEAPKFNRCKSRGMEIHVDRNFRTINQISDKRLKLGYRLMLISGLRVSEVADLEPGDIRIRDDGVIDLHIRNGKGGKTGNVECMKDGYVRKHLRELLDTIEPGQKVFYSAGTMEKQATNLGMECHDLRRIYSKHRLRELIEEEAMSKGKAHQIVQKELRHESGKTTDLYLYGRKFV